MTQRTSFPKLRDFAYNTLKNHGLFGDTQPPATNVLDYGALAKYAAANNKTRVFFQGLMSHLDKHMIACGSASTQREYWLSPALTECRCKHSDRFHSDCRFHHEEAVVHFAKDIVTQHALSTLNYASIGCGGLLEDFILLYK